LDFGVPFVALKKSTLGERVVELKIAISILRRKVSEKELSKIVKKDIAEEKPNLVSNNSEHLPMGQPAVQKVYDSLGNISEQLLETSSNSFFKILEMQL
jgi:hypothetical protein